MANGINTAGTKLEIGTGTGGTTLVQVKGFTDFSGLGGGSAAVIDQTDFDSVAKEKAMGLPDEGQISINLIYLPKDPGQVALRAARGSRALTKFTLTLSDGTKYALSGYVLTMERTAGQDDVVKASCNIEISGAVVETAAP